MNQYLTITNNRTINTLIHRFSAIGATILVFAIGLASARLYAETADPSSNKDVSQIKEFMEQQLTPYSKKYKSTLRRLAAKSSRTLEYLGNDKYKLEVKSSNILGRFEESSLFKLSKQMHPIPLEHKTAMRGFGIKRTETTTFDWKLNIARWRKGKEERETPIYDGVVDRLLYQLLIPRALFLGQDSFSFDFAHRGKIRTYDFNRIPSETIEIGSNVFNALRVQRDSEDSNKRTTLWFAPSLNYELLRILHQDDEGASYRMELINNE